MRFNYDKECYKSALRAYNILMNDEHSGYSIIETLDILNKLVNQIPLSPIEDKEDEWNVITYDENTIVYQSKRMYSLFKTIFINNNKIIYSDVNRCHCIDIDSNSYYYSSIINDEIMNILFPISMPYMPSVKKTKFVCETFLVDSKNGDFDTKGVLYCILPSGDKILINKFFKEENKRFIEIDIDEYNDRKKESNK